MNVRPDWIPLFLSASAASSLLTGCFFFAKPSDAERESESQAIHAMSNNLFGTNVQAYMWGLTTADMTEFEAQGGAATRTGPRPVVASDGNGTRTTPDGGPMGLVETPPQQRGVGSVESTMRKFYQCWYVAKTDSGVVKVDGEDLVRLFLERAEPVGTKFVDAEKLMAQLKNDERTRRVLAFSVGVLPIAACGGIGMLQGWKHAAIGAMMCNLGVAAFNNYNGQFRKGDVTWGSAAAQEQIQKEIKRKVDQLEEVNWDVLDAIHKKVNAFDNDPNLVMQRERTACPKRSPALVKYMGTTADAPPAK